MRYHVSYIICVLFSVQVPHERNCEDSSWIYWGFKCYKMTPHGGSYDSVRDWCRSYGAEMVVYDTRDEYFMYQHRYGNHDLKVGLIIRDGDSELIHISALYTCHMSYDEK